MNCTVVIPVYRGEDTLGPLVERLHAVLPNVAEKYELILVNDGSPDESWKVITGLASRYSWVIGIDLMRNFGQHNATLCGIRAASYEIIVTMDDDLQNLPEEIPKLVRRLHEGFDVVYGVPETKHHPWWKNWSSALVKAAISWVMGVRTVRDIGPFKAFRADLRQAFEHFHGPDVLVDVLLSWGTSRFGAVPVVDAPRAAGKSNYSFGRLLRVSLLVLTSYTTLPLRLASVMGFLFTVVGLVVLLYVLAIYFSAGSVPGFPFQASLIAVFSGAQLFALGIIGEYLARVFERTGGRRAYAIARTTGGGQ